MAHKSFEQLAKSAYEAWQKELKHIRPTGTTYMAWEYLTPQEQAPWVAVAKQLWAEFAALH